MIHEFYKRINLNTDISNLSKAICQKYDIGKYISEKVVLVGYEDFNFILTTDRGKFCVKVFNKGRTDTDISKYIDRIELANTLEINTPKAYKCNKNILCKIELDDITFRLCVFEYIDGKSFYDLNQTPSEEEIKNIIFQMAEIHKAELNSEFIYDNWTITNFIKEYEEKGKYVDKKYTTIFNKLSDRLKNVNMNKLPRCVIHGDIITSNVMKDNNGKLWIIDFASSNYLPRIIDLAVAICDFGFDEESKEKTANNIKKMLNEYQKYNKLTDYELQCFPLFYNLVNAIGILQISYLKKIRQTSKEDKDCINEYEKGLNFSTPDFWENIINACNIK